MDYFNVDACQGAEFPYAYTTKPGTYTITDVVTDRTFKLVSPPATTNVTFHPPVVLQGIPFVPMLAPYNATAIISCSARRSTDDVTMSIDWSDGSPNTVLPVNAPTSLNCNNLTSSHSYSQAGTYNISVVVTGKNDGVSSTPATTKLEVANVVIKGVPTFGRSVPYTAKITIMCSRKIDPNTTVRIDWDYRGNATQHEIESFDLAPCIKGSNVSLSHYYRIAGTYPIKVLLNDSLGKQEIAAKETLYTLVIIESWRGEADPAFAHLGIIAK